MKTILLTISYSSNNITVEGRKEILQFNYSRVISYNPSISIELRRQFSIEETRLEGKEAVITVRPRLSLPSTFLNVKEENINTFIVNHSLPLFTLPWQSARRIEAEPNPIGFSSPSVPALDVYVGTACDWNNRACWNLPGREDDRGTT